MPDGGFTGHLEHILKSQAPNISLLSEEIASR